MTAVVSINKLLREEKKKLTQEEFVQPLDTLQLACYIQGYSSKLASDLKVPTIYWLLSVAHSPCILEPLVGKQAYNPWSACCKLTREIEE